ncbi:MAG: DUF2752 domain-containing protein [Lachnospiraceae bacterium]|nr:DUF2752 domain-containing protein [Lachnospiraceae bacterium]
MKQAGMRLWRDVKNMWVAAAAIAAYTVLVNLVFHAFCPMVIFTGLPCPACGMTRALFYLVTGNISASVQMNPLGLWIVCLFLYFAWNRYIIGRDAKGMKIFLGLTFAMLIIGYIWRMLLYFPDKAPYVYTERNVLTGIFPFYEQILHELHIL